jgi:hypothetical protein
MQSMNNGWRSLMRLSGFIVSGSGLLWPGALMRGVFQLNPASEGSLSPVSGNRLPVRLVPCYRQSLNRLFRLDQVNTTHIWLQYRRYAD